MNRKVWLIIALLYSLIFVITVITADFGMLNLGIIEKIPYYDLFGHFIVYGMGSVISYHASGKRKINLLFRLPLAPFLFSLFTIIEEILQKLVPSRTFSYADIVASLAGIVLFYLISELYMKKKIMQ